MPLKKIWSKRKLCGNHTLKKPISSKCPTRIFVSNIDMVYLQLDVILLNTKQIDPKRPEAKLCLGISLEYLSELSAAAE